MSIIIDIMIPTVLVIFVILGKKAGFVKTFVELLGWLSIIFLSFVAAGSLAGAVYDGMIRKPIYNGISKAVTEAGTEKVASSVSVFFEGLPSAVKGTLTAFRVTPDSVTGMVINQDNVDIISNTVADAVRAPMVAFISLVISVFIFILGIILVKLLAKACSGIVSKIPIVSGLDRFLGAIAGLFKGAVIISIAVWIISMIAEISPDGFLGIKPEVFDNTYIFSYIDFLNPMM